MTVPKAAAIWIPWHLQTLVHHSHRRPTDMNAWYACSTEQGMESYIISTSQEIPCPGQWNKEPQDETQKAWKKKCACDLPFLVASKLSWKCILWISYVKVVFGNKVLFLLIMLAENRKACSSAFIPWALGPSAYSKIPPARKKNGIRIPGPAGSKT